MKTLKYYSFFIVLILLNCWISVSFANADDEMEHNNSGRSEIRKKHGHERVDLRKRYLNDDGNEVTGQTALWLLVAANLTTVLSLIMKASNRFLPLGLQVKGVIKDFNYLQKKYLMIFHYFINPLALCIAIFHFLLSYCRSSAISELGLLLMLMTAIFGLMLKLKASPKKIKKIVYRLHTSPIAFSTIVLLVFAGHMIVE